jgi:beta-glucosidase
MSDSGALLGPWSWHGNRQTTLSVNQRLKPWVHSNIEAMEQWDTSTLTKVKDADVLVVMTGEEEKESGEARSKVSPQLSEQTVRFIHSLKTLGKPIVLVITAGRPLILTDVVDHVDGLLYAYFLGTEAANSIVDTLFGVNNPSAKLTMSFPRHLGQIPISYNHLNTGRPFLGSSFTYTSHYIDASNLPLFSFGDGLSYSHFEFAEFMDISTPEKMSFQIQVSNLSSIPGFVIIPVYLDRPFAPVALANLQLVGMKKIWLNAFEKQRVEIVIDTQFLSYIDGYYNRQPLQGTLTFRSGSFDHPLMINKEI